MSESQQPRLPTVDAAALLIIQRTLRDLAACGATELKWQIKMLPSVVKLEQKAAGTHGY